MDARREVAILVGVVALVAALAWALSSRAAEDTPPRPERPSPALSPALRPVVSAPPRPRVVVTPVSVMPCPFSIAGIRLGMPKTTVKEAVGASRYRADRGGCEIWYYQSATLSYVVFDDNERVVQVMGCALETPSGPIFPEAVDNLKEVESRLQVKLVEPCPHEPAKVQLRDGSILLIQQEGTTFYFSLGGLDPCSADESGRGIVWSDR